MLVTGRVAADVVLRLHAIDTAYSDQSVRDVLLPLEVPRRRDPKADVSPASFKRAVVLR